MSRYFCFGCQSHKNNDYDPQTSEGTCLECFHDAVAAREETVRDIRRECMESNQRRLGDPLVFDKDKEFMIAQMLRLGL